MLLPLIRFMWSTIGIFAHRRKPVIFYQGDQVFRFAAACQAQEMHASGEAAAMGTAPTRTPTFDGREDGRTL